MAKNSHRERKDYIMAEFTRAELRRIFKDAEIEVPKDVLSQLCDLHTSSTDDISAALKETETKLKSAEKERDEFKAKVPEGNGETVSKTEFDKIKKEYEDYKNDIATKETHKAKSTAYRDILKADGGFTDATIDLILKASNGDIDNIVKFDKDGKHSNKDDVLKYINDNFGGSRTSVEVKGTKTSTPPQSTPIKKTKEEIMAIKDTTERQTEIAKNLDLFQ